MADLTIGDFYERPDPKKKAPSEVYVPPSDQIPAQEPAPPALTPPPGPNGKPWPKLPKDVLDPNPFAGAGETADASVLDPFAGADQSADASVLDPGPFAGAGETADASVLDPGPFAGAGETADASVLDPVPPGLPWAKILIGCGVGVVALTLLVALLRRRPPLRMEDV